MFSDRYWSHKTKLEFRVFWKDSRCSQQYQTECQHIEISQVRLLKNVSAFVLNCLESFGGSEFMQNWFGESWTRPQIRKSWKWRGVKFSQSERDKFLVQNEAEYFYGAFGLFIVRNLQYRWPPKPPWTQNPNCSRISPGFPIRIRSFSAC